MAATTINLVAALLGVSVVPRSMQGLQAGALAYIPLRGRPVRARLSLAHRTRELDSAVLKFTELTREAARSATK